MHRMMHNLRITPEVVHNEADQVGPTTITLVSWDVAEQAPLAYETLRAALLGEAGTR